MIKMTSALHSSFSDHLYENCEMHTEETYILIASIMIPNLTFMKYVNF